MQTFTEQFYVFARPILAVYCLQLLHEITCRFSKYFQILYIFTQIFKYFALFQHFFVLFLKTATMPLLSRISPGLP